MVSKRRGSILESDLLDPGGDVVIGDPRIDRLLTPATLDDKRQLPHANRENSIFDHRHVPQPDRRIGAGEVRP